MKRRSPYDAFVIACVVLVGICAPFGVGKALPGTDPGSEEEVSSQRSDGAANRAVQLTQRDLELKGTVVTGFEGYNLAVIECLGKQGVYREGDRVGDVRIHKIFRNKAIVRLVDRDELLVMDFQRDGPITPAMTQSEPDTSPFAEDRDLSVSLEREALLSSVEDVQGLMKSARLHPRMKGGKSAGFLVSSIKPGSLLAKMGLRNGDTIVGVNGEHITSVQQAVDFYKSLVEGEKIALEIKRRGQEETVELVVE